MNIEEQIKIVKNMLLHAETQLLDYEAIAIETLLTAYEKEKVSRKVMQDNWSQNVKLAEELKAELEKEKEKNKEYNMGIKNLISQIESAIDFMKTDKSKIKVDMYKQKEEDLKLEIVHLKKLLKEE